MVSDSLVISDRYRTPIVAQRHFDDPRGVVLRTHKSWLVLSGAEFDRLVGFVRNEATLQRYVMAPIKSPITSQAN